MCVAFRLTVIAQNCQRAAEHGHRKNVQIGSNTFVNPPIKEEWLNTMNRNGQHTKQATSQQYQSAETQNYFLQHDFDGSAELTTTLVHAISDVTGIDVTDAGFTLNDHVDPDALDQLFKPKEDGTPRTNGHVSFTVWGYQVTVYSTGQIAIIPPRGVPQAQQ